MLLTERSTTAALTSDPVVSGSTIDALDAVCLPHVALALWERPAPDVVARIDLDSVDDLSFVLGHEAPASPLHGFAAVTPPADAQDSAMAASHLIDGGYPADIAAVLADDIALLASVHRRLTGRTAMAVRLDVVETDACRRFHADYVTLRMLCTYSGAGTQWCRVEDVEQVHELPIGAVGVFKGRVAMEEPAILHRSPPLLATHGQRLLLVLDPA